MLMLSCRSCVPKNEELHECEKDHVSEAQSMEDLGRLLGEVKSYARCDHHLFSLRL